MNIDGNRFVKLQKLGKQSVGKLRRDNLNKGNRAEISAHAKALSVL